MRLSNEYVSRKTPNVGKMASKDQSRPILTHPDFDGHEVGAQLESAVQATLEALEQSGVSARDADEFIRDCVFNAWWGWDYEPAPATTLNEPGR